MEGLSEKSMVYFMEVLSSDSPVPGGGAVSALSGSMAASLCEMVAGLSVGKKKYLELPEEIQQRITAIGAEAREMKGDFLNLFERDILAFLKVMEAFKLPKDSEEEKVYRRKKIEESYTGAMEVPLEAAQKILPFFDKIETLVHYGNVNCISDAAVASLQAHAAIHGAILNVKINLSGIGDGERAEKIKQECDHILMEADRAHAKIMEHMGERL